MAVRTAKIERETRETHVSVELSLDGFGRADIRTGIGFLDHMLELLTRHGMLDLVVRCQGDLEVDCHHTTEDVGICLGQALAQALGTKEGITRYGLSMIPMDEALTRVTMDISGRPYLVFDAPMPQQKLGNFDTEMVEEFFRAVAFHGGLTLHMSLLYGKNTHHMIESLFKGMGRALDEAKKLDARVKGVPSTKGVL